MLQAKERAPTPFPSVVFTFGLIVESIKELGGASYIWGKSNRRIWKTIYCNYTNS
jgi:hypothetical protein